MNDHPGEFVRISVSAVRRLIEDGPCPQAKDSAAGEAVLLAPDICVWCGMAAALSGSREQDR